MVRNRAPAAAPSSRTTARPGTGVTPEVRMNRLLTRITVGCCLVIFFAATPGGAQLGWGGGGGEPGGFTELRRLKGPQDPVPAVAFSPDGTLIATASNDATA